MVEVGGRANTNGFGLLLSGRRQGPLQIVYADEERMQVLVDYGESE
jgi:hypothetical protein